MRGQRISRFMTSVCLSLRLSGNTKTANMIPLGKVAREVSEDVL